MIVWDRLPAHRSRLVRDFVERPPKSAVAGISFWKLLASYVVHPGLFGARPLVGTRRGTRTHHALLPPRSLMSRLAGGRPKHRRRYWIVLTSSARSCERTPP